MWKAVFTLVILGTMVAPAVEIPWNGTDKVTVSVTEGSWTLRGAPQRGLRLEGPDLEGEILIEKKEGVLGIKSRDQLSKSEFGKASGKPKNFELTVPANADLEFHLLDGSLSVSRLTKDGILHVHKGKLVAKELSGSWILHQQKGDMQIFDSTGRIEVDSQSAHVSVKGFNGDVDLSNFAGDSILEKVKGTSNLTLGSGSAKVLISSGSLQFELMKGSLTTQQFGGRVEGVAQEGNMNFQMNLESDLHVRTQSGKVLVTNLPQSGAFINVSTQEGDLAGPSYLKVARDGGSKYLKGRLHGEVVKSSIFIRSQEGSITLR